MRRSLRLSSLLTAAVLFAGPPAHAETFTTFKAVAEGCAGGGTVCGSYPAAPVGEASSHHQARIDGSFELAVQANGGIPAVGCIAGSPCVGPLAQYHAEAAAHLWVDVPISDGAQGVVFDLRYRIDGMSRLIDPTLGPADGTVLGVIDVVEASGQRAMCSDGSDPSGRLHETVRDVGEHTTSTTILCPDGTTLGGSTWEVGVSIRIAVTTAGGAAQAGMRGAMASVSAVAFAHA